jgi:hypothetical protein
MGRWVALFKIVSKAWVTGTSHERLGRGCEDVHVYRVYGRELLLIAVADGAGSASFAASGANVAAQCAIEAAERILYRQTEPAEYDQWQSVLRGVLTAAREALVRLAEKSITVAIPLLSAERRDSSDASALRNFATTLLVAIATLNWIAVAQVGDGAVVIQYNDGTLKSLTPRQRGEYINETCFLTDEDFLSLAEYNVVSCANTQGIALLTDGLQLLTMSYPANTPHAPFFEPLFRFAGASEANPADLARFLASERVCSRTDDDKTLVLAVHR